MFLNPRDINHLLHINDTVKKKKAHADSPVFLRSWIVFCCCMCTFILNCLRIFIAFTGNREIFTVAYSITCIVDLHELTEFWLSFYDVSLKFYLWGLAVRREWWSIGIVWCFSIDYGNVSRWIEQGGVPGASVRSEASKYTNKLT